MLGHFFYRRHLYFYPFVLIYTTSPSPFECIAHMCVWLLQQCLLICMVIAAMFVHMCVWLLQQCVVHMYGYCSNVLLIYVYGYCSSVLLICVYTVFANCNSVCSYVCCCMYFLFFYSNTILKIAYVYNICHEQYLLIQTNPLFPMLFRPLEKPLNFLSI